MKRKLKRVFKNLYKNWMRPEMSILPGQIAFFLVLSMIPLIALIVALTSAFSISINDFINGLLKTIPSGVASIIKSILQGDGLSFNMTVFYISALVLASNGAHSMILASNTMYKFKNKNYISRRLKALIMTAILVLLILFVIVIPAFGDFIFKGIEYLFGSNDLSSSAYQIYKIVKYPLSLVFIFISVKLLYTMAPDTRIKSVTTTKGTLLTTIGWVLATEIYSYYVGHFTKYNIFYGSVANIIILMLWIYILAYIFVLGMALNETEYEELNREKTSEIKLNPKELEKLKKEVDKNKKVTKD